MIRRLCALGGRGKLKLGIVAEEIDLDPRGGELDLLLGAIVYQAMHDGMLKVRVGIDRASGEPFMKYFGPLHYAADKQIWWDMVAPPSRCYPRTLQICMSLAQLQEELPIKGIIAATKHRKRLNLHLAVEEIGSFEIAWDEKYASDRSGERTVIDLPGSEGEEGDDSAEDDADGEDAGGAGKGEGR